PLTLYLASADWPCAGHMHPTKPKKKKKTLAVHQTEHVQNDS
ncbi:unnamed protein product, partial [Staurois parvus]